MGKRWSEKVFKIENLIDFGDAILYFTCSIASITGFVRMQIRMASFENSTPFFIRLLHYLLLLIHFLTFIFPISFMSSQVLLFRLCSFSFAKHPPILVFLYFSFILLLSYTQLRLPSSRTVREYKDCPPI